jgi:exodeoxyribonuclease V beta subunit
MQLIEAGAGTGKTYTITSLFLRLILEVPGIDVRRILVVTFTEAATAELRDRVRSRLRKALLALQSGEAPEDDEVIAELLQRSFDRTKAADLLKAAVIDFDEAAIFTIHGFCQRVLRDLAYESGGLFDTELITTQDDLVRRAVDDYWRKTIYRQSQLFVAYALRNKLTADSLYSLAGSHLGKPGLIIVPKEPIADYAAAEQAFLHAIAPISSLWETNKDAVQDILSTSPGLNHKTYRKDYVANWISQLDAWFSDKNPHLPLPKNASRFTNQALQTAATKKPLPLHPFFDAFSNFYAIAQELEVLYSRHILALKAEALDRVRLELERSKQERNIQYFDDLLLRLYHALHGPAGPRLAAAARAKFSLALIDEFQDTDPVQYAIFTSIFTHKGASLFLIGDPKQAIYSFRTADIFTYLQAVDAVPKRHRLDINWRSDPDLIRAVNALFTSRDNAFLFDKIQFQEALPAPDKKAAESTAPLELWFVPRQEHEDCGVQQVRRGIARCVADEIVRLIDDGEHPGDIAVLVRAHQQADMMQSELGRRGVASIRQSTGSLFDTDEAAELELVLKAVAAPFDERRLRPALATTLYGMTGGAILALGGDTAAWEERLMAFSRYHDLWQRHGFFSMLRYMIATEHMLERLVNLPRGERRVTNILHLAEVLHRQDMQLAPGMEGLVEWLALQRNPGTQRQDEYQLRLESDADAVKLVTIHKSKGLEYPIVFCPFAWSAAGGGSDAVLFHDPENNQRLTLDIGSGQKEEHKRLASSEALAEDLRLLYVALTRAKRRCYFVWGAFDGAAATAPSWLFHSDDISPEGDFLKQMKERFKKLEDADVRSALDGCAARAGGAIAVRTIELRGPAGGPVSAKATEAARLTEPSFSGQIRQQWRLASFSSLIAGRPHEQEFRPPDEFATPAGQETSGRTVFTLPAGPQTGTMLHEILERADFADPKCPALQQFVKEKLAAYGMEAGWSGVVISMVEAVAAAQLAGSNGAFSLSSVPRAAQLHELGFHFPLQALSKKALAEIFAAGTAAELPDAIEGLTFSPVAGFMTGFIDLVFEHDSRFYLIDWKSNFLGAGSEHYAPERIAHVMRDDFYFLQYHLYTLALHRYLQLRLPGYDYEKHFGGAFYVFLRGLSKDAAGRGIFYDRPPLKLIREMEDRMIEKKTG